MTQFVAIAAEIEVNGETVRSFLNGMSGFEPLFEKALVDNGLGELQDGAWYSQQAWLNAFKQIAERTGPGALKTIGRRIICSAYWPPEVRTVEKALASIDQAYHLNHRGGEIGSYHYSKLGERMARIVCNNPYPCDFDIGVIDGAVKRFARPHERPLIVHERPDVCRKSLADACSYLITW